MNDNFEEQLDSCFSVVADDLTHGFKIFSKHGEEVRYGNHGSLLIDKSKKFFKCFESGSKGKTVKLVEFVNQCSTSDALNYLKAHGHITETNEDETKIIKFEILVDYIYKDEDGRPLFKNSRCRVWNDRTKKYEKSFRVFRWEDEKWVPGAKDTRKVLFRNELIKSFNKNEWVFLCEGEKDVLQAELHGLQATTNIGGASSINLPLLEPLRGFKVAIVVDSDKAGRQRKEKLLPLLKTLATEVSVIDLPDIKQGYDLTDYFKDGATTEMVLEIANKVKDIAPKFVDINDKGRFLETRANFKALCEFLGFKFHYDIIKNDIVIDSRGDCLSDTHGDDNNIMYAYLQEKSILYNLPYKILSDNILYVAKENSRNCVEEWLKSLPPWDGVSRIDSLADCLVTDEKWEGVKRVYLKKWMLSAINTVLNGVANQSVLVLSGSQGCGKSRFLEAICSCAGSDLFKGGVDLNPSDKDSVLGTTNHWLVELGEIDSTFMREASILKAFLTRDEDTIRSPYARAAVKRKRVTSFCGSVNLEDFLSDVTGARRYWVIPIEKAHYDFAKEIAPLVWAELYSLYLSGESGYMSEDEYKRLNEMNKQFQSQGSICERVAQKYCECEGSHGFWKSAIELIQGLDVPLQAIRRKDKIEVRKIADELFTKTKMLNGYKYYYVVEMY